MIFVTSLVLKWIRTDIQYLILSGTTASQIK